MILPLILLGMCAAFTSAQEVSEKCPETNLCVENYCNNCYSNCQSNLPPEVLNGSWVKMFENLDDYCDCCRETFVPHIEEGERCFNLVYSYDLQDKGMCGPGLSCLTDLDEDGNPSGSHSCQRKKTNCHDEQDRYDEALAAGELGLDETRAECDEEGYYSPLQCYFAGTCRCVNKETGLPIFGFTLSPEEAESQGVDCACSRQVQVIKEMSCSLEVDYNGDGERSKARFATEYTECMARSSFLFQDHLRCMPSGNFDPAQCIKQVLPDEDDTMYPELCFCIDAEQYLNSSLTTIGLAHLQLECHFLDDTHYPYYYRPCELARNEYFEKTSLMSNASSFYLTNEWVGECNPDGFFSSVQRDTEDFSTGYCSDIYNNRLEEYTGIFKEMDCLCAQVKSAMLPTDDRPVCIENGSFRNYQCRGERCYCVNQYGKQTTMEEDILTFNINDCL